MWKWPHLRIWSPIGTKLGLLILYGNLHMFMWSKVMYQGQSYQRSSCMIGWRCYSGLIWKFEVPLEPNLVYWYNMGTFICSCSQRSYTKVKDHLRSTCKIGWKCENGLIWKVEVRFEPNLVYWYNMETFICSCSQRSQIKVKGHLRSTCKITWKCKFWLICILEKQLELP